MYIKYRECLSTIKLLSKYRKLSNCGQGNKEAHIDFANNDYLCLSKNKYIIEASINACKKYGTGATGSRLLSGNIDFYSEFEQQIAKDKLCESSLIFSSGFQANATVLSSLLDRNVLKSQPIVFFDRLNHSSLYQAIFMSNPELCRYHHNDMNHLQFLLNKYRDDTRSKFIVTETVFGMDGDIAQLKEIERLCREHKAFLYLDESHATGVLGKNGYGLSSTINLKDIPYLIMGTFSKALGGSGGYVCCAQIIKDYLINKSPGFIYSTAPSPATVAAAFEAWDTVKSMYRERQSLICLSKYAMEEIKKLGLCTTNSTTHIISIILGDEDYCMESKQRLLNKGIKVSAIRSPTVPPGSSRLRIALNTKHTKSDIDYLVSTLKELEL